MKCNRCKRNVPDFLWVGDDHPVLLDHPMTIHTSDLHGSTMDEAKVSVHVYIRKDVMCSGEPEMKPIFDWTVATPVETAVFEALGAASTCWEKLEGAGVFDSSRAKQIGDELVAYFQSKGPIY